VSVYAHDYDFEHHEPRHHYAPVGMSENRHFLFAALVLCCHPEFGRFASFFSLLIDGQPTRKKLKLYKKGGVYYDRYACNSGRQSKTFLKNGAFLDGTRLS
jgi:hypothetical protein